MAGSSVDRFVTAGDGLRLHARDYAPDQAALPVVCLPGLSRNAADFHALAAALAEDPVRPRRVVALDYRGRGLSERDADWRNYDVKVEAADVLAVLTALDVEEAVFVGTSRGGIITMALTAARPAMIRGAVLNDIGPVIEAAGLARIRGYVGRLAQPSSETEAAEILKGIADGQFPALSDEDWLDQARATWREEEGRLVLAYDPALGKTLEAVDPQVPPSPFWPLFEGLKGVPVLALRGENSDILSAATLAEMARRHPRLEAVTVPGQGHAPWLSGGLVEQVKAFIARVDGESVTTTSSP